MKRYNKKEMRDLKGKKDRQLDRKEEQTDKRMKEMKGQREKERQRH